MKKNKSFQGVKDSQGDTHEKEKKPELKNDAKRSKLRKYPNRTGYHGTHDERTLNVEE